MKKIHELTGKELEQLFADAGKKAIKEAHTTGQPTTHGNSKGLYRLYPNGKKEYFKLY